MVSANDETESLSQLRTLHHRVAVREKIFITVEDQYLCVVVHKYIYRNMYFTITAPVKCFSHFNIHILRPKPGVRLGISEKKFSLFLH